MPTRVFSVVFWVVAVLTPVIACVVAVGSIPDVPEVPLHWGFSGEANRWGTPGELAGIYWFFSLTMAAVNAFMAACHAFNDRLYDMGFVHGVSKQNAPKVYIGCAILIVVVAIAFLTGISSSVAAAL